MESNRYFITSFKYININNSNLLLNYLIRLEDELKLIGQKLIIIYLKTLNTLMKMEMNIGMQES